jgi:hypothetical protein
MLGYIIIKHDISHQGYQPQWQMELKLVKTKKHNRHNDFGKTLYHWSPLKIIQSEFEPIQLVLFS